MRQRDGKIGDTPRCAEIKGMVGHPIDSPPEDVPHGQWKHRDRSNCLDVGVGL